MTCPPAKDLQGLLDGALPEPTQAELTAHLETCPACRTVLDKLATDGRSFSQLAPNLLHPATEPEPGLRRVLAEGSDPDVTQAELPGAVNEDLPFLAPSAKPGHLGRLAHYEILEILGKGGF